MSAPLLEADDVVVAFPAPGAGAFGMRRRTVRALNGVSLSVRAGETLGLVGESGSGKSTFGRAVLALEPVTSGHIVVDGVDVVQGHRRDLAKLRLGTAMVFQVLSPRSTLASPRARRSPRCFACIASCRDGR